MELLIILIIIIVILVILGVSVLTIIAGAWWLLGGLAALSAFFFVVMSVFALLARRKDAVFLRLEKGERAGAFAIYEMDGVEYRNTFPTDLILEKLLYQKKNVKVKVFPAEKPKMIFDGVTLTVIGIGLPAFALLTGVMFGLFR